MDPVRGDHDISRYPGAVCEGNDRLVSVLLESDAPMVCLHHIPGQSGPEHLEQISTVHAVKLDPASGLSRPHRCNQRAIAASVLDRSSLHIEKLLDDLAFARCTHLEASSLAIGLRVLTKI